MVFRSTFSQKSCTVTPGGVDADCVGSAGVDVDSVDDDCVDVDSVEYDCEDVDVVTSEGVGVKVVAAWSVWFAIAAFSTSPATDAEDASIVVAARVRVSTLLAMSDDMMATAKAVRISRRNKSGRTIQRML